MLEKGHEMMVGIQILMRALNVEKALIGIENNKLDAIKYLKSIAGEYKGVEVHGLKVKFMRQISYRSRVNCAWIGSSSQWLPI